MRYVRLQNCLLGEIVKVEGGVVAQITEILTQKYEPLAKPKGAWQVPLPEKEVGHLQLVFRPDEYERLWERDVREDIFSPFSVEMGNTHWIVDDPRPAKVGDAVIIQQNYHGYIWLHVERAHELLDAAHEAISQPAPVPGESFKLLTFVTPANVPALIAVSADYSPKYIEWEWEQQRGTSDGYTFVYKDDNGRLVHYAGTVLGLRHVSVLVNRSGDPASGVYNIGQDLAPGSFYWLHEGVFISCDLVRVVFEKTSTYFMGQGYENIFEKESSYYSFTRRDTGKLCYANKSPNPVYFHGFVPEGLVMENVPVQRLECYYQTKL